MGTTFFLFPGIFLCHFIRFFTTNKNKGMENSTRGESTMKTLLALMKLVGRIATVILLSPTDGALWNGTAFSRLTK